MVRDFTDAEYYFGGMEPIESNIMKKTFSAVSEMDLRSYRGSDVENALAKERLDIDDFASLLSPAAEAYLEEMALRARDEKFRYFGNSVSIFTPLYVSNYCENGCVYCGFNRDNVIHRAKLSVDDIEAEMSKIAESGLTEILILTGESREMSDTDFIGECVKAAAGYFHNVGVEVYPLNVGEYGYLHDCGADYVTVFQETYDPVRYAELHPFGPKRIFSYRFNAQERALMGGMRGVAFGALLGLGDFRRDAMTCGIHAYLLQRKYPHAEISLSLPRIRPFLNGNHSIGTVSESNLLQIALAYRIFMPFSGQTISSRESPVFRDNIVGLSATKISAGVSVGIGGHAKCKRGDEQFDISDQRDVGEIRKALVRKGLQPVFKDYVRT
ncbi:MAG: 2-iminoacetate synthase ThiH [Candidatus Methanoplasma sp.]|jgi:2-iminoacetate synthase|nr:2-iminoacetate synthase ThiH [Candidatus Methanoplasma sp.]